MDLSAIKSRLGKYLGSLSQLNKTEGWGPIKSVSTYFDYFGAYVKHGCLIDQYINGKFYTYRNYYRKRIITQRRLDEIIRIANKPDGIHLLENKADFNRHFSKWVKRGWAFSETMTLDDFSALCKTCKYLFVKPLDSYEGKGIERIETPADEESIRGLYDKLKGGRFIIEQELKQHPGMIFGNKSVNTLRINTLLDREGNVHIFKPVLRTGVGDAVVDNYNAGGVEYAVDTETGIITMPGYSQGIMKEIYHPGTDIKMVGYQIPMWKEVIETVTQAARHIPQCRYIGWDVAITPDGIEFIEGNHNPGYVCMEYFGETGWYGKLKKYLSADLHESIRQPSKSIITLPPPKKK
ncbi:MAG: hypothetical protein HDS43_01700 [Bacteroides sp.]|nr:hypothetical protein [Bacteroides sp.]